jgi:hypothetical protein
MKDAKTEVGLCIFSAEIISLWCQHTEEKTTQWPKEKGQQNKQWSTNGETTHKTKDGLIHVHVYPPGFSVIFIQPEQTV